SECASGPKAGRHSSCVTCATGTGGCPTTTTNTSTPNDLRASRGASLASASGAHSSAPVKAQRAARDRLKCYRRLLETRPVRAVSAGLWELARGELGPHSDV